MVHGVRDDVVLEPLGPRTYSCLPAPERRAHYDVIGLGYDNLISSNLYNRLAWGVDKARYASFLHDAVAAAGGGWLLDAGCGSCALSGPVYRARPVQAVLLDRSAWMLRRSDRRVPAGLVLLQADLLDLPFAPGSFDAVLHFGVLHVLPDPEPVVAALAGVVRPGGTLHVACVVQTGRRVGDAYIDLLHRGGELGPPLTADRVVGWLERHGEVTHTVEGSWVFAVLRR